jgi:MarR family transcriptional regulator, organic hydroperoxide resistance regulator
MKWKLDDALGFWMHLAQNRVRMQAEEMMAPFGVTPEQWAVLARLWEQDDRTQTELAEATFRDRPSVTRMIDGLEQRGYVVRARHPADGRSHRILLTQAGRELEQELVPRVAKFVARWTRNIPERDLATTRRTLRALYENLS